jgi:hypothetical protein
MATMKSFSADSEVDGIGIEVDGRCAQAGIVDQSQPRKVEIRSTNHGWQVVA